MSVTITPITVTDRNSATPSFGQDRIALYQKDGYYYFPDLKIVQNGRLLSELDIQDIYWSALDGSEMSEQLARLLQSTMRESLLLTNALNTDAIPPLSMGKVCLHIRLIDNEVVTEKYAVTFRDERLKTPPVMEPDARFIPEQTTTVESFPKSPVRSEKAFSGWAAFDFGTTNSTVTLFDARNVPSSKLLTREAFVALRDALAQMLKTHPDQLNPEQQNEWDELNRSLMSEGKSTQKTYHYVSQLGYSQDSLLFQVIYSLENKIRYCSPMLKSWVYPRLQEVYTHMTHTPPLSELSIYVAYLDPADKHNAVIPSEVQVTCVNPLQVVMGNAARQAREQGIHNTNSTDGQFHTSIKNCLFSTNDEKQIIISDPSGAEGQTPALTLLKETLNTLKKDTELSRLSDNPNKTLLELNELVITYPTIAPPVARRKLKELISEIGFQKVDMTYDEATASALFYVLQEYMSSPTRGLSAFQSRSKKRGNQWYQRIIILDIGGGTTDVAMLNLKLHEEDPFETGEDRGAGGKYYVITPQLEISTGELQLGGDLLTLKTFKLIKALICDRLMMESQQATAWQRADSTLPDEYRDSEQKYIEGSLVKSAFYMTDTSNGENETLSALQNILLPTNWSTTPADQKRNAKNAFYTLWDQAEKVKKRLGAQQEYEVIPAHELESLFMMLNSDEDGIRWPAGVDLRVNLRDFEEVIKPHIREAISLATGLLTQQKNEKIEVDRIILSGQTCHLRQVHDLLNIELSKLDQYIEVTFDPQYSKLSTSIGACYAHKMMKHKFDSKGAKRHLARGVDVISIDVQNLHFNLPCSFERRFQRSSEILFKERDQLMLLNPTASGQDEVGAKRSPWLEDLTRRTDVYRLKPSSQSNKMHWGEYDIDLFAQSLGENPDELVKRLSVQFEVDQYLNLYMYLCAAKRPMYTYRAKPEFTPVNVFTPLSSMSEEAQAMLNQKQSPVQIFTNCGHGGNHEVKDQQIKSGEPMSDMITEHGTNGNERPMIKKRVPATHFNTHGELHVYAAWHGDDNLTFITTFKRTNSFVATFPMDYHLTLDNEGLLALHVAEVPYLEAQSDSDLLSRPGSVKRISMESSNDEHFNQARDPFSGIH